MVSRETSVFTSARRRRIVFARFFPIFVFFPLAAVPAAGVLHVTPAALDFGERGHGERGLLKLTLKNIGATPLRITSIKSCCDILRTSPAGIPRPLGPGGTAVLDVTMQSGRAMGILDKYITIETDGNPRALRVPARMSVFAGYSLAVEDAGKGDPSPLQPHLEGDVGGRPVSRSMLLKRASPPARPALPLAFEVVGVTESERGRDEPSAHFATRLEDVPGGKRLHITLKPTHPEGRFLATVRARLDGKPFEIPVSGEMFRGIRLSPAYINFNRVEAAKPDTFRQENRLTSTDDRPFKILGTEVKVERSTVAGLTLESTAEPAEGGKVHLLRSRIVVPEGSQPKGSFSGKVFLQTDHPEKAEVVLGFFGFFP
jgi:hypothetical protein